MADAKYPRHTWNASTHYWACAEGGCCDTHEVLDYDTWRKLRKGREQSGCKYYFTKEAAIADLQEIITNYPTRYHIMDFDPNEESDKKHFEVRIR